MAERSWILNLNEIGRRTFHSDRDIDTAVKAACRRHCITVPHATWQFEPVSHFYPDLAAAAVEAKRRGFIPVVVQFMAPGGYLFEDIRDWLAEVHVHSPRHHRAILNRRMSFAQMIAAARRWHAAQRRAAERLRDRAIARDDIGAPTVLELDGEWLGWRWVWLKSDAARDAEGLAMGNYVGRGYYDGLGENAGVFSLRDPCGEPHVTAEIECLSLRQDECRGGADVTDRFRPLVDRMAAIIGVRLKIHGDPTHAVGDGVHVIDGAYIDDREYREVRETYHIESGVLHRDVGPARISEGAGIYYERGVETWRMMIHSDSAGAVYYACRIIDHLRDAVIVGGNYFDDADRYRIETRVSIEGEPLRGVEWTPSRPYAPGETVRNSFDSTSICIRPVPPAVNANIQQEVRP